MKFSELKDFDFVTVDIEELVAESQAKVEEILGRKLERADPLMIFLKSILVVVAQLIELVNDLAKQNLLAFARDKMLDEIGVLVGVERLNANYAQCTAEITLSTEMSKVVTVKAGTRINAGDEINFALDETVTFLPGETVKQAKFTCQTAGTAGNGYAVGKLNKIVDPQPFLESIVNVTESDGGADIELDDSLRERIRLAPESFSTAGSFGAYEFFTYQASSLITDVYITSENPVEVDIYFLENGDIPSAELIDLVRESLKNRARRPLTDNVIIKQPATVDYDIDLKYYINSSERDQATTIQADIDSAIADFVKWQKSKIGRDLNNTELEYVIRRAGAKRVEITSPAFTRIDKNSIARCNNINVVYAGLEED